METVESSTSSNFSEMESANIPPPPLPVCAMETFSVAHSFASHTDGSSPIASTSFSDTSHTPSPSIPPFVANSSHTLETPPVPSALSSLTNTFKNFVDIGVEEEEGLYPLNF